MRISTSAFLQTFMFAMFCILSAVLVYPVITPILTFISLYRQLVNLVIHGKNPACRQILSGLGACVAGPDPYNKPALATAFCFLLDEKVEMKQILKVFTESILDQDIYPELKQRLVRKWGYYFWKDMESFRLEHNIRYLYPEDPDRIVYRDELRGKEGEKVVYALFDPRYSPWDMVVVPNVVDPDNPAIKSAIYFRYNHCLMDGLSLMKLLEKTSSRIWELPQAKSFDKDKRENITKCIQSIVTKLKLLCTGPCFFLRSLFSNDSSEFLQKALKGHQNKEVPYWSRSGKDPKRFSKNVLKTLASFHNVSMSSLITTIAGTGVANFVKLKCEKGFSKLPKQLILHSVLPVPDHPDALVNHWTAIRLPFKIDSGDDPVDTLQKVNKAFKNFSHTMEPMINYWISYIAGYFPAFLLPDPRKDLIRQTILMSSFPGAKSTVDIFGYKMVAYSMLASGSSGSAFIVGPQNLYDQFWIDAGGVSTILEDKEDIQLLTDCFQDVIRRLSG